MLDVSVIKWIKVWLHFASIIVTCELESNIQEVWSPSWEVPTSSFYTSIGFLVHSLPPIRKWLYQSPKQPPCCWAVSKSASARIVDSEGGLRLCNWLTGSSYLVQDPPTRITVLSFCYCTHKDVYWACWQWYIQSTLPLTIWRHISFNGIQPSIWWECLVLLVLYPILLLGFTHGKHTSGRSIWEIAHGWKGDTQPRQSALIVYMVFAQSHTWIF